jgi:hypothetical protein
VTTQTSRAGRLEDGWPAFGAAGVALSLILTAFGTLAGVAGGEPGAGRLEWLVAVAITLAGAIVVFGLVATVVTPANAGTCALGFGLLGLGSLVVFWSGLPAVLAFGALACGAVERYDRGRLSAPSMTAATLAALTIGFAVWLAAYG